MSNRPRSLHELAEAANYNLARFPELPDLANGAHEIMRQARLYEDEKDLETAYILFRRAYTLAHEMPRYPQYATALPILKQDFLRTSTESLMDAQRLKMELQYEFNVWSASQSTKGTAPSHPKRKQDKQSEHTSTRSPKSESSAAAPSQRSPPNPPLSTPPITPHRPSSERTAPMPQAKSPSSPRLSTPPNSIYRPSGERPAATPQQRPPSSPKASTSNISNNTKPDQRTNQGPSSSRRSFESIPQVPEGHSPRPFRPSNTTRIQQARSGVHQVPADTSHGPKQRPEARESSGSSPSSSPKGLNPSQPSSSQRLHIAYPPPPSRGTILSPIYETNENHSPRQRGNSSPLSSPRLRQDQPHACRPASTVSMHEPHSAIGQSPPSTAVLTPSTSAVLQSSPKTSSPLSRPRTSRNAQAAQVSADETVTTASTSGTGLRTLIIPGNLIEEFTIAAAENTIHNIETCGWIMGVQANDVFIATVVVIPKQTGTADTCTTTNEEEIWDIYREKQLHHVLGWIHTHPQHDLFMSSIDLHTQLSFQKMLPEGIAVVVCPEEDEDETEVGIFRLTDPQGLETIRRCQSGPGFHSHPNTTLYTSAEATKIGGVEGGGHVKISPPYLTPGQTELIDLR